MDHDSARAVPAAAHRALMGDGPPFLLAVSGGLDSMVLLAAACLTARHRIAAVATFDHGTGAAARRAAAHVARAASAAGVPVVIGRARSAVSEGDGLEAAWRGERLRFLRESADALGVRIATAHTEDDHLETVLMRVMRGSGARGLAGLFADGVAVRPFVGIRRAAIVEWACGAGVRWLEDPSNASRDHLRNRVRLDLLPALCAQSPGLDDWLLELSRRADALRREIDHHVDSMRWTLESRGRLCVAREELAGYDRDSMAVLWTALASRAGLALDGRGTRRIAAFTIKGPRSGAMPLRGGWMLEATPDVYRLGRTAARAEFDESAQLPTSGAVRWGGFEFRVVRRVKSASPWEAALPGSLGATIRAWSAGDRFSTGASRRRVKRYLSEAGVHGTERSGWPVVVAGDDVVWIPGVRRSDAATDRSGRPVLHYVCERIDR